jgi:hypothetical protein
MLKDKWVLALHWFQLQLFFLENLRLQVNSSSLHYIDIGLMKFLFQLFKKLRMIKLPLPVLLRVLVVVLIVESILELVIIEISLNFTIH